MQTSLNDFHKNGQSAKYFRRPPKHSVIYSDVPIDDRASQGACNTLASRRQDKMTIQTPREDIDKETNKCFHMEVVIRPTPEINQDVVLWDGSELEIRTNSFEKKRNWTAYNEGSPTLKGGVSPLLIGEDLQGYEPLLNSSQSNTLNSSNLCIHKSKDYGIRDWGLFNNAQKQEGELLDILLKELCNTIPEPERKGAGRPPIPLSDQIFCAVKKVYGQTSSRRAYSAFKESEKKKHVSHAPYYNSVSKTLLNEDITPILRQLIRESALPLRELERDFAIDSSGFRCSDFGWYCSLKHGVNRQHNWVKAHICIGVNTNIITDVVVTIGKAGDSPQLKELITNTADGFLISEVSADKAYSSKNNLKLVEDLGGVAYIPFRSNTVARAGRGKGSKIWKKMYYLYQYNREEFDKHYHKRSNVETTFSAIKMKLKENLKSKNFTSQKNELLCKILANNITVLIHEMHRSGIKPDF